ncbi:MAG: hypothetical protein ACLR6J_16700 [Parabacteroides merdae]
MNEFQDSLRTWESTSFNRSAEREVRRPGRTPTACLVANTEKRLEEIRVTVDEKLAKDTE